VFLSYPELHDTSCYFPAKYLGDLDINSSGSWNLFSCDIALFHSAFGPEEFDAAFLVTQEIKGALDWEKDNKILANIQLLVFREFEYVFKQLYSCVQIFRREEEARDYSLRTFGAQCSEGRLEFPDSAIQAGNRIKELLSTYVFRPS
jgi:hypothetical protein